MSAITPAAIDGLNAVALRVWPQVQRFDGPLAEWPLREFIAIGLGPTDPDMRAVREARGPATTAKYADITNMIRVWTGDTTMAVIRARAYELFDGIVAELERDNRMGERVHQAEVVDDVYVPAQTRGGALVDLVFTVRAYQF